MTLRTTTYSVESHDELILSKSGQLITIGTDDPAGGWIEIELTIDAAHHVWDFLACIESVTAPCVPVARCATAQEDTND